MQTEELSRCVHTALASKNYEQALQLFKSNKAELEPAQIAKNPYLVADMLTALRGIKAYDAGFQFITIYKIEITEQTPLRILNSYGWLLYFWFKNTINLPQSETKNAEIAKAELLILNLLRILNSKNQTIPAAELAYSQSLAGYFVQLYFQYIKNLNAPNWKRTAELCQLADPELLSDQCHQITIEQKGKPTETELASVRELWYAYYSKALYETGMYESSIELCQTAIQKMAKLHYSNKIWFTRRIAQCHVKLLKPEIALPLYEQLTKQKPDWFLLKELSECYMATNQPKAALQAARRAAASWGPINFKVELIEFMGNLLANQAQNELAWKHFNLAKLIREAEKWHIDQQLLKKMEKLDFAVPTVNYNKDQLKNELVLYWSDKPTEKTVILTPKIIKNINPIRSKAQTGIVTKILAPKAAGTDGFIKSDGEQIYFFLPTNHPDFSKLQVGQKFTFDTIQAEKGPKAINIFRMQD